MVGDPSVDEWRVMRAERLKAGCPALPAIRGMHSNLIDTIVWGFYRFSIAVAFDEQGISLSCLSGGGVLL